jgi:hypothetical protein
MTIAKTKVTNSRGLKKRPENFFSFVSYTCTILRNAVVLFFRLGIALLFCAGGLGGSTGWALQWNWEWTPDAAETSPEVSLSEFKYGKTWAYTLEIDDAPLWAHTFSIPFLANYHYTDAPPGVSGGTSRPLVGSVGAHVRRIGGNTTFTTWNDMRALAAAGWGASNHSYWHISPQTELQIREDLYWSQVLHGLEGGTGRGTAHFIYPNGWLGYAGTNYIYLKELGFFSAIVQGGAGGHNLYSGGLNLFEFSRYNLDPITTANPTVSLSASPPLGEFVVDFTHHMSQVATDDNYKAWQARLAYIANTFGQGGANNVWSAPSAEVVAYSLARKAATATVTPGRVRLNLPDTAPGASLTLKLTNIPVGSVIPAPPGGLVYRSGTTVWLTTPFLGQQGTTLPTPRLKRVYSGNTAANVNLGATVKIAGIRIRQFGDAVNAFKITLTTPSGAQTYVGPVDLPADWGDYLLYSNIPTGTVAMAPQASAVQISPVVSQLRELEIWAVDENVTTITSWRTACFSSQEIANGLAADSADPDGDGVNNLLEYALGGNPKGPDTNLLPVAQSDASGYLKLVFKRDANKPDLTYTVESSSDPTSTTTWSIVAQSAGGAPTMNNGASSLSETGAGSVKTVTVLDCRPAAAMKQRFMRLKVNYSAPPANQAPSVSAGLDQTAGLAAGANLSGSVTDDGLAPGNAIPTVAWSKISGPGTVTFGQATAAVTTASFSAIGTYVLRLTGSDGVSNVTDDVTVTVTLSGPSTVLKFDFGSSGLLTSGNWNNVTTFTTGSKITNAVNTTGTSTSIGLSITAAFENLTTQGSTSTSGVYPASAMQDSFFVQSATVGKIKLTGLNPSLTYTLTFFASRLTGGTNRVTQYKIGTTTVTLDATDNTTNVVSIANQTPAGDGSIEVEVKNNVGAGYGYLGVLELLTP